MHPASGFAERAAAEIDALHRLLQAWFRGEGGDDPAPVLQRFDEGFLMVTPAGRLLPFAAFAAGFPALRGTRSGTRRQARPWSRTGSARSRHPPPTTGPARPCCWTGRTGPPRCGGT